MSEPPKNDLLKDLLAATDPITGEGPLFYVPPEPLAGGTEVGGAPTTDSAHEYMIRKAKPLAQD